MSIADSLFSDQDDSPGAHKAFGEWRTEADAAAELDRRLDASGLFNVYKEVDGIYLFNKPNKPNRTARIDRILSPRKILQDAGWTRVVGVEIKKSGEKIGKAIAQASDYMDCAWKILNYWVLAENIFLWPFERQHCSIESVMLQSGIGALSGNRYTPLTFHLEKSVIRIEHNGVFSVSAPTSGMKLGSR